jgi:DNA adenine methylase
MYKGLQNGYELPENLSVEQYKYIKEHKDEDTALTGFVGFACSFGGKWFGGYAKNNIGRNYCLEGKKHTLKIMKGLENAKFLNLDYRDVEIPKGAVVYCDPPYVGTTDYCNSKSFNHEEFWQYMRELSKEHKVFISEQTAPPDFECIWSKTVRRTLDANKSNMPQKVEKLFVYRGQNK